MIYQKLTILILIILSAVFQSPNFELTNKPKPEFHYSGLNPDSLDIEIKQSGWNADRFSSYYYFLINSEYISPKINSDINSLKESYQKNFLKAILLKRNDDLEGVYKLLVSNLNENPSEPFYFEELVFSANAVKKLTALKNKITSLKKLNAVNKNFLLGLIAFKDGEYELSKKMFLDALQNDSLNCYYLYYLSYTERNLGDYSSAFNFLLKAEKNTLGDEYISGKILLAKGSLYFLSGKYDLAGKYYQDGYDKASINNYLLLKANALVDLGIIKDVNGNIAGSRKDYNSALNILNKLNDIETKAYALSELGVSYTYTGELINAKNNYLKSYSLYKKLGNSLRLSLLSDNIAKIFMTMFDFKSALKLYEEGLSFSGEDKRAQAINLMGLGDVYTNLSNYSKALEYYNKAKKIASEIKEVSTENDINAGLGALYFNLDNYKNSLKFFDEYNKTSIALSEPHSIADSYYKLGVVYSRIDSLDLAEEYLTKASKISVRNSDFYTEALIQTDLAYINIKKKDFKKALENIAKSNIGADKIGYQYQKGINSILSGIIEENEKSYYKANENFLNSLKIADITGEFNLKISANYELALLSEKMNLPDIAEKYFNKAIDILEDVSKPLFNSESVQISYLASKREVYDSYANFLLNKKDFQKAFEIIDRSSSRNTLQNLNNLKIESGVIDSLTLEKIYDYDWIIHSGIYSAAEVDSIKELFLNLKQKLVAKNPELSDYLNLKKDYSLSHLQNKIKSDEYLVSIYNNENNSYIFVVSHNDFKHYKIDLSSYEIIKLLANISPYFDVSSNFDKSFYNQDLFSFNSKASFDLYQKLLKNALKDIPENKKVVFILPPVLASIPFEFFVTSYDNSSSAFNYNDKHYLLEKFNISYSPSASLYVEQENNNLNNNNKTLILGNPAINKQEELYSSRRGLMDEEGGLPRNAALLPLKYSEEEVSEIGSIIHADNILVEKSATETNFKKDAQFSKIIHLSTHSFLYKKQPVIFLSNVSDPGNDGYLEASEIVQMKLNSDLVVLSSCNSGLGIVDKSEGILGMTKAFFDAGAKSVVVSLWAVNDKYTAKLMVLFYKKLSEGLSKSEALRQAKLEFIKEDSPNPYFWSAFVLSGNTSAVQFKYYPSINNILITLVLLILIALFVIVIKNKKFKIKF